MNVIIAGSRTFRNWVFLKNSIDSLGWNIDTIISGHASGADSMGERYADYKAIDKEIYPANWKKHGKSAGYIRNSKMATLADALIAFWDGKSKGTKHMIDIATKAGLEVIIFNYECK